MIYLFFYEFFKKYYIRYIFYLLSLLYLPINKVGMPHVYGKLISTIKSDNMPVTIQYLIILIVIWITIEIIKFISTYLKSRLIPIFSSFIRDKMVGTLIDRYKNDYEELNMGDTITKIIKSPWLLEDIIDITEDFLLRNILIVVSSFAYLFYYNKQLGLIYLACILSLFIIAYFYSKDCTKYVVNSENKYDKIHEEIEDTLSNLISVYTSRKTQFEKNRLSKYNTSVYKSQQDLMRCNNRYRMLYTIFFAISFIVLNFYAIHIYTTKKITIETLIAIIIINYSLLGSFMNLYHDTRYFIDIKGRLNLFNDFINNLPKLIKEQKLTLKTITNIELKNVTFYYNKDNNIIDNLNLSINKNDIIGLVGTIGSGKTTICNLLVRLKLVKSGAILFNNVNINSINIDNLRTLISFIPQHPKLFNRTLYENLVYGTTKKITEQEIYTILEQINIPVIYKKFKAMMHKKVGKHGSHLSGGQRQIVWLIRSVMRNSKVIILDEPTASLDEESKEEIIKFIKLFSKNKILILITHDSDLLKYVNRIIKLKKGKIISDNSNL